MFGDRCNGKCTKNLSFQMYLVFKGLRLIISKVKQIVSTGLVNKGVSLLLYKNSQCLNKHGELLAKNEH